jgi:hypothetical protein
MRCQCLTHPKRVCAPHFLPRRLIRLNLCYAVDTNYLTLYLHSINNLNMDGNRKWWWTKPRKLEPAFSPMKWKKSVCASTYVHTFLHLFHLDLKIRSVALCSVRQGCQMVYFQTKIPTLGKYCKVLKWKILVCFTYGCLVNLTAILYFLWPFGIF